MRCAYGLLHTHVHVCLYMPTSEWDNVSNAHLCVWYRERNWLWVSNQGSTVDERPPRLNEVNRTDSIRRWISTLHITVHLACSLPGSIKHSISASPSFLILASSPALWSVIQLKQHNSGFQSVACSVPSNTKWKNKIKNLLLKSNITSDKRRCHW